MAPPRAPSLRPARRAALREVANKLLAYRLVRTGEPSPRVGPEDDWSDLVAAVYRRGDDFSALFRLERLGHDLALLSWDGAGPPDGLLAGERAAALPESSLLALHLGIGLAFADRLLGGLGRRASEAELDRALRCFVDLCRDNARAGYVFPAWETLGVVVRLFYARWTALADQLLASIDHGARACYWHGVGRAVYFLPRYSVPGSTGRSLARCRREPPDAGTRADALNGFAFAATMVNLRHPPVLEALLVTLGDEPAEEAAVTAGIASCLLARRLTTPEDPAIPSLLAHRPAPGVAELWERRLREPVERALTDYFPRLLAAGRLPELARHQDLPTFLALAR